MLENIIMDKDKLKGTLIDKNVVIALSDESRELYNKSRFGDLGDYLQLSLLEAMYLADKDKLEVHDKKDKLISKSGLLFKFKRLIKNFWVQYCVFKDFRDRGYIIKTALKFGAEFRVYDRGVKPGEDHAKWVVFPVHESDSLTWHEFSAKNRVAHSTKKRLLIAVVDDEADVTYYEVRWLRP